MSELKDLPVCGKHSVDNGVINSSKEALPKAELLYRLSDFFKVLGDSTRLGILFAIDGAPMCVCDISRLLGMTKSAVSHQLKTLRQNDLVSYERVGKQVFYRPKDKHVKDIIEIALAHAEE